MVVKPVRVYSQLKDMKVTIKKKMPILLHNHMDKACSVGDSYSCEVLKAIDTLLKTTSLPKP